MIDLKPNDHARLRRAFRFLDDQAPLGADLPDLVESTVPVDRKSMRFNPAVVVAGTVLVTLLLFLPIALLVNEPDPMPSGQTPGGSTDASSPAETPPVFASGDNWNIVIWVDGSEICYRDHIDEIDKSITSEGCQTPSSFSIPNVMNVGVSTGYDVSGVLVHQGVLGFVIEEADRIVVTFQSGDTIELEPQETVRHGYRGFGVTDIDAPRLGEPTTIEVFNGETSLGVYSHESGQAVD